MNQVKIAVYTLIDITATGNRKNIENTKSRDQQRNWETAEQLIGLRTHTTIIASPGSPKFVSTERHEFGSVYNTTQVRCWKFIFRAITGKNQDIIKELEYDFNKVPIIPGLDETITLDLPIFNCTQPSKNIYFKILPE